MRKLYLAFFLLLLSLAFQTQAQEQLVVVYSTSWCGHCKNAKSYLNAMHVEFTNYDIETSEVGKQKYQALKGKGVPLIFVGNQRIDGFDKPALEKALKEYGLIS